MLQRADKTGHFPSTLNVANLCVLLVVIVETKERILKLCGSKNLTVALAARFVIRSFVNYVSKFHLSGCHSKSSPSPDPYFSTAYPPEK